MREVQVIGAGLSGLATAWYLTDASVPVHVIEARPRPGGLLETCHEAEGLVERAAQAFTWTRQVRELFEAVGVQPCFAQPQSRRRYIVRDAKPRRWPLSPVESAAAAARLASAWAGRRMRPRDGETVASWGRRVVGVAATTWLIAPALQGVYASSPDVLSARAVFGSGRRLRGVLAAPVGGMGELVDRLHTRLSARGVTFEFGQPVDRIDSSAPVVVCTDAPAASRLLAPQAAGVARAIARIRQVALRPVTAFFEPKAGDLCGFGVLFPRGTRRGARRRVRRGRLSRAERAAIGDLDLRRRVPRYGARLSGSRAPAAGGRPADPHWPRPGSSGRVPVARASPRAPLRRGSADGARGPCGLADPCCHRRELPRTTRRVRPRRVGL